jgi:uncharacterized protein involved in outer membrane biogenesis
MKRILTTIVLVVVALIIVTVIVIGVYLGQIVKKVVNTYGPQLTQTTVSVDTVTLSLLTGSASLKELVVGNPQGYKSPNAISVGKIAVGVDPMTVFANKVVVRSIRLESPAITFEGGVTSGNNLSQILDNVDSSGGKGGPVSTNAAAAPASQRKFEVDDLLISGAKADVLITSPAQREVKVTLPDIHLTDLGKGSEGITAADLTKQVLNAITTATVETVAKQAMNLDQNAATLKQAGQGAKQQLNNTLNNLLQK